MSNATLYQFTPGTVAQSGQAEANDFAVGSGDLFPRNPVTGVVADAAGSLGDSLTRFKELYIRDLIYLNGYTVTDILDEDDMASNSASALATQQSIKAYVDNMDYIGTVQLVSANGNISTSFTKVAAHKVLRFAFSGSVIGNTTGSVALYIAGNLKMTWTTQGPSVSWGISGGGFGTAYSMETVSGSTPFGKAYLSGSGATGASGMMNGQDWFDITSETNGSVTIAVTFTNVTNGSAAIYRNRV